MRTAGFGMVMVLLAASVAVSHASEHVLVTSGVVKAVDAASGVVVLDSGVKLRVRTVMMGDQLADVAAIRVNETIFVSGIVVGTDGPPLAQAGASAKP